MKRWLFITILSFVLLFASATIMAQEMHLIVASSADITSLDPHGENDQPSARVRVQIYDTLVWSDEDMNLQPGLAEKWEQVDETTYIFYLRKGVKFHNGEPLTAEDVKFTLDRLKDPATAAAGAFIVGAISEVNVIDEHTVEIKTAQPFAPLIAHLSHSVTSILNKKAVTEAGDDYGTLVAVGTGPYIFESWVQGSHLTLVKNKDYWKGEPKADRITFRFIPENSVRAIEVETGGVDIAYDLDPVDVKRLQGNSKVKLSQYDSFSTTYIGMNATKPPFDNPLVRKAINHAVDKEAAIDVIYSGQAIANAGPIGPRVWGYNPNLKPYEYDPALAKALLAEAGYPNGFKTTIWTNENALRIQVAELFQADLAQVGIDVEIKVLPWATYLEETGKGNHDMFILGWSTVTGDADYGLYALFHTSQFGSAGNRTFWGTEEIDKLLDLGRQTIDPEERLAAYWEAQEKIVDGAPWVFLFSQSYVDGMRSNIEGFVQHPTGSHRLWTVEKK